MPWVRSERKYQGLLCVFDDPDSPTSEDSWSPSSADEEMVVYTGPALIVSPWWCLCGNPNTKPFPEH